MSGRTLAKRLLKLPRARKRERRFANAAVSSGPASGGAASFYGPSKAWDASYASVHRSCLAISVALLLAAAPVGADTYPRQPSIDAIHYVFRLTVEDASNRIAGETTLTFRLTAAASELWLDLASATAGGQGMTVTAVTVAGSPVVFNHANNRLRIPLPSTANPGAELQTVVTYSGVPANGLRLIPNIHGERTMFSENWPNRAREWLAMIDHPYDKATGEFIVTAPAHYQVVANGRLEEEVDVAPGVRRTHWNQAVPIASWLYALGVARFSVHHYDVVRGIPQEVWVFPQDREKGYDIFELRGRQAFEFFSDWVGPYSYEKLAHVQAAGINGGTEHASNIFYGEKGVASGRAPVVHEVAHQWFGDAVTEKDWDDVWLSEGFATYFTHLFNEHFSGRDAFVRGLKDDVAIIVATQKALPNAAVIHDNLSDMEEVLNRLVYQKGGWVLHMLRGTIGTEKFWTGIREYYRRYRNENASTDDFRQVMEAAAGGLPLSWFFDQWLKRPGMPTLRGTWRFDAAAQQVRLELSQLQGGAPYRLPLEVALVGASGQPRIEKVEMTAERGEFTIPAAEEPSSVTLDPNTWVLMQVTEFAKR